jgi:aminoglycoside phosphotransferase (APT) family kinase protein
VLRRYRRVGFPQREATVIEHARRHGFPVPRVVAVRDDALVLERIHGLTMWQELRRRPWRARRYVALLADLHRRLHRIDAPAELDAAGSGTTLLHLDFHPENVLMSPHGPVVIDWTNARRGDPALDVALTWVIGATSGGLLGRALIRVYLRRFDLDEVRRALPAAADRRLNDPNVTERERTAVRALLARELS